MKTDPNIKLTISAIYNLFILFPAKLIISYLCRDEHCSLPTKKNFNKKSNFSSLFVCFCNPQNIGFLSLQNIMRQDLYKKKIQFSFILTKLLSKESIWKTTNWEDTGLFTLNVTYKGSFSVNKQINATESVIGCFNYNLC